MCTWLRQWSYTGVLGQSRGSVHCQTAASLCSLGLPWELSSVWLRPWLGAAATRHSIHGSDYLLAWQFFFPCVFSLFLTAGKAGCSSFFKVPCQPQQMGGKPLFGIKTALSFPLLLTIKIPTTKKLLLHCQRKKIHIWFFIQTGRTLPLDHIVVTSVPLLFQNDGQEQDDKMFWE